MDITQSSSRVINSFPPLNNIAPFTRVDGWSFLEVLEGLRNYIVNTLIPELDADHDLIVEQMNAWFAQYQIDHAELLASIVETENEWQVRFDAFMLDVIAQLQALNDQSVANLINDSLSQAGIALRNNFISKGDEYIHVRDYGAKPDGSNAQPGIMAALNAANGRRVVLESDAVYTLSAPLTLPVSGKFNLSSTGVKPAKLYTPGQTVRLIDIVNNTPVVTHPLVSNVNITNHGWMVANVTNVVVGMLCEVKSSKSWYHDPRPESNDARKSEVHKVVKVDAVNNLIWMEDAANDTYNLTNESVDLTFYNSVDVRIDNVSVEAVHPAVAPETSALLGVVIQRAMNPLITKMNVKNCAYTGISIQGSYKPIVSGGEIRGSNSYWTGYGVSISSCANAIVEGIDFYECRRGVDVTGGQIISRNTEIRNNTVHGGGWNSRGEIYTFPDTVSNVAADQYGFGSHGPASVTRYTGNRIFNVRTPFSLRGDVEIVEENLIVGRTWGGVISMQYGSQLYVLNNTAVGNYYGVKDFTYGAGQGYLIRPDSFIVISETTSFNVVEHGRRGRLVVKGNNVEVQRYFMRSFTNILPRGLTHITGNSIAFANSTDVPWLVDNASTNPVTDTIPNTWFIGPNAIVVDTGPQLGGVVSNTNPGGRYVNHVTAGPKEETVTGSIAGLAAPIASGATTTVQVVFPTPFVTVPKVVLSGNSVSVIVASSAVTVSGFTASYKAVEASQYGAGATYVAVGMMS